MSLISVNQLTFYYEGSFDNIFEDVSFQMDTDWKLGFVARNGRGKTTFLNLLMGKYEYRGSITSAEEFDYFPFQIKDDSKDTLAIIEELYPEYEFWKICRELSLLMVDGDVLYRSFQTLSNGEQTKVMLAVLFSMDHRFLLIDEPTNHLDVEARKIVKDYLCQKKGFILVSHDRDFLDQCIDHVLVINKTNIEIYQGNFSTWWQEKQRQDAYELSENERLKKDISRLTQSARQKSMWADTVESTKIGQKSNIYEKSIDTRAYVGEKSRRMQMRRKNLERRQQAEIDEKSGLLKNIESAEDLKIIPLHHYKNVLVKLEDVEIYYPQPVSALASRAVEEGKPTEAGKPTEEGKPTDADEQMESVEKWESVKGNSSVTEAEVCKFLKTMNFTIENGECVILKGRNGSGKSSIIKAVLEECGFGKGVPGNGQEERRIKYHGRITAAQGLIISYVSQDTSFLKGSLTEFVQAHGLNLTLFMALLRKLDFNREQFEKKMEDYSGGQKKKVLIAKSLCEQAHLYIWDEPLNFIDVFSRMQIEELLLTFRPTMLMVEHDRIFVDKIGNKIIDCE